MGIIDFILNLAALLLWMNWLPVRFDPLARASAATLVGTLRKAGEPRKRRWVFGASLVLLLVARAFFYWQIGAGVNWTPKLNLGAITLSFPLSFRGDFFGLMLLYSLISFMVVLTGFYLWLLLLSFLSNRGNEPGPFFRLVQVHLGPVARWPWPMRLLLPWAGVALLWLMVNPLLVRMQIVPPPVSWGHRLEQGAILGVSSLLVWQYLIGGLLALHILNSYVYLGRHPFWNFVTLAAGSLLKPLRRLPMRVDKVDLSPLLGIAIVMGLAYLAENGRDIPFTTLRLPSLADVYRKLPL